MADQLGYLEQADLLLAQTIAAGFGGFGTSVVAELERLFFLPDQAPEGLVLMAGDTCPDNPFGPRASKGAVNYLELAFQNPAATLAEMLRRNPEWSPSLDPARLRFTGVQIATSGVLKHHARLLAAALHNRGILDEWYESVVKSLTDQVNHRLNHGELETFSFAGGGGGTGFPWAIFNRLRAHARSGGGTAMNWHEGWFLGPDNYPSHPVLGRWYKMNFVSEMTFLSHIVRSGTESDDPRFNPVLPGFEDRLDVASGAGKGFLLPRAFNHIMLFDRTNIQGKSLPVPALLEMAATAVYWRSRLPMLANRIRFLILETYDHRAKEETAENVSYCFGGVDCRTVEPHPQLSAVQACVAEHQQALLLLHGESGAGPGAIKFGEADLDQAVNEWRQELNARDFRPSTPVTLAKDLAFSPRQKLEEIIDRIQGTEEKVANILDRPGVVDNTREALAAKLTAAVETIKRASGLRRAAEALVKFQAQIEALAQTPAESLPAGWEERIREAAAAILPASRLETDDVSEAEMSSRQVGALRGLWAALVANLTIRIKHYSESKSLVRPNRLTPDLDIRWLPVANELARIEAIRRSHVLSVRRARLAAELAHGLETDSEQAKQLAFAAEKLAAAKLAEAKGLLERAANTSPIRYIVRPTLELLLSKTKPSPSATNQAWQRLEEGESLAAAVSGADTESISFAELVAADPGVVVFLRSAVRDLAPHFNLKPEEISGVPLDHFMVSPAELEGYLAGIKLHFPGKWEQMRLPGLPAIVLYAVAYGLPARASQSMADCEPEWRQATDAERYESSLFPEWRQLPSVYLADRLATEEVAAAAMVIRSDVEKGDVFPVKIDGVEIVASPPHLANKPNPCGLRQDPENDYLVVVQVPGGQIHERPLRTDKFAVAVDLIGDARGKYLDPLRRHLGECAFAGDYLLADVLQATIEIMGVCLEEWKIITEDRDNSALSAEEQKSWSAISAVLPKAKVVHAALQRFAASKWVEQYKRVREGKVVHLDAALQVRARRA